MQHLIAKFYFTFLKNLGQNNNEQDFDFFFKTIFGAKCNSAEYCYPNGKKNFIPHSLLYENENENDLNSIRDIFYATSWQI